MMKRLLILLLACLFLWGCEAHEVHPDREISDSGEEREEITSSPVCLYDPDSLPEAETAGVLKVYPLRHLEPTGLWGTEEGLLLMGEADGYTLLQTLTGEELTVSASLSTLFSSGDSNLQIFPEKIACYDPMTLEIVLLDTGLQELMRISVPADISGTPLLSPDASTAYYCTRDAVRALEPDTGISRVLKEISGSYQTAVSLHAEDALLQCSMWEKDGSEKTLLLSTENGRLLWQQEGPVDFCARDGRYICRFGAASQTLVFGREGNPVMTLIPAETGTLYLLPRSDSVLSAGTQKLTRYDLTSGKRTAELALPAPLSIVSVVDGGEGIVWILGEMEEYSAIFRWDTTRSIVSDATVYTGVYSTDRTPDGAAWAECESLAQKLRDQYGLEILLFADAANSPDPAFSTEAEVQPAMVLRQLTRLEEQLAFLPASLLDSLKEQYAGLRLQLVRSIHPDDGAFLPDAPEGVQFWENTTACITLASGQGEDGFFRALFAVLDTAIYTRSSAFDRWEDLNPLQFSYTLSYSGPLPEGYEDYLQPETRAFADSVCMVSAKEERARIFGYAIRPGKEDIFQSHTMQKKLTVLCKGIREAFGLQKQPEIFPWERYLNTPLAPGA